LLPLLSLLIAAAVVVAAATPAAACGGLVAPDGAVRLDQTTTLAAYHDGVEHYVTSFQYAGGVTNFGSIIPLPAAPTDVRRAGSWTLQRLEREVHPIVPLEALAAGGEAATAAAQVILQTTVDALDITVLKGGSAGVIQWIKDHGYFVSKDAPAMLEFYARRSPYFLAARFDATKAATLGVQEGDGTPIEVTIPTASPWVPLHILTLAKIPQANVQADVFLLTDRAPALLGLDPGVGVRVSEPASAQLLSDLHADTNSAWVPSQAWLTYLNVDAPASALNHDLAIDPSGSGHPSAIEAGYLTPSTAPAAIGAGFNPLPATTSPATNRWAFAYAALFAVVLAAALCGWTLALRRTRR
jgi:hypothetical protein